MTNTINRYRLARPGDEGRDCWVSDGLTETQLRRNAAVQRSSEILDGVYKDKFVTVVAGEHCIWKFAIVAAEAPDPGEGYRLLKKLEYDGEDEQTENGDEYWNNRLERWIPITVFGGQCETDTYRRRIEPVGDLCMRTCERLGVCPKH